MWWIIYHHYKFNHYQKSISLLRPRASLSYGLIEDWQAEDTLWGIKGGGRKTGLPVIGCQPFGLLCG
jgi:hypothetical protein